jgi:hypothetical protein
MRKETRVRRKSLAVPSSSPLPGFGLSRRFLRKTVSRYHLAFLIFIAVLIYLLYHAATHLWDYIDHSALWQTF